MKKRNFITSLHQSTKRNYIERMINDKVFAMKVAKKYGRDYWDGSRKFGYGGLNIYLADYPTKKQLKFMVLIITKL